MERLRGPQLPIHPYSTKDLEKKKLFGVTWFLYAHQLFVEKVSCDHKSCMGIQQT